MISENNITTPIKDSIKDTLVPLRTNFNANGSVRWRTSFYLNLFHCPMGKNSGNRNGVCRYVRALLRLALEYQSNKLGEQIRSMIIESKMDVFANNF